MRMFKVYEKKNSFSYINLDEVSTVTPTMNNNGAIFRMASGDTIIAQGINVDDFCGRLNLGQIPEHEPPKE